MHSEGQGPADKFPRPSEESGDASKDSIQARPHKTKGKGVKKEGKSVKVTEMNY